MVTTMVTIPMVTIPMVISYTITLVTPIDMAKLASIPVTYDHPADSMNRML